MLTDLRYAVRTMQPDFHHRLLGVLGVLVPVLPPVLRTPRPGADIRARSRNSAARSRAVSGSRRPMDPRDTRLRPALRAFNTGREGDIGEEHVIP